MNYGTTEFLNINQGEKLYTPTFGIDEHTIFMCHCDKKLPTDDSFNSIKMTACDEYELVEGKFNNGYLMNAARIETEESNLFTFGKRDFTVEAWIYPNEDKQWHTYLSSHDNYKDFQLNLYYMVPKFYFNTIGDDTLSGIDKIPVKEWSHIAVCRKDGILYMFVNGKLKSTQINKYECKLNKLDIGMQVGSGSEALNGIIDEIRISDIARWTEDFTPPEGPYVANMGFNVFNLSENFVTFGIHGDVNRINNIKVYVDDKEVAKYTKGYPYIKHTFEPKPKSGAEIKLSVTFDDEKYELSKKFPYPKLPPLDAQAGITDVAQRTKEMVEFLELNKSRLSQILVLKGAPVSIEDRLGDLIEKVFNLESVANDVNLISNGTPNIDFVFYRKSIKGDIVLEPNLTKLICTNDGPTEWGTDMSINMKDFDKIVFEVETANGPGKGFWVAAGLNKTFAGFQDAIYKEQKDGTGGTIELDVSNDNNNRYIGIGGEGIDITIKSIKLLKKTNS